MTNKNKAIQAIIDWLEQSNKVIARLIRCYISCDNCPFSDKECTIGKRQGQLCEEFVMDLLEAKENEQ